MEAFIVFLLLFGAISLGSTPHEGGEEYPVTAEVAPAGGEPTDGPSDAPVTANADPAQLHDCLRNRHDVIYRDLSRVRAREIRAAPGSAGTCDGVCTDE